MTTAGKPADPRPRSGRKARNALWIVLGTLVLVTAVAWEVGLVGFGFAELRAATFPSDQSLLAYFPGDASAVAIFDPHQLELKAFGADGGVLRQAIDARRADLEKATGVDIAFDVDKVATASGLVVARGRFDALDLAERLAPRKYVQSDYRGAVLLERAGVDAVAVVDDDVLLYGSGEMIRRGLDADADGTGLDEKDIVTDRLDAMGWDHPFLATVALEDGGPSLHDIITGTTGPRAVTVGIRTKQGADVGTFVQVRIEAASQAAAAELSKLLEEKRGAVAEMAGPGELGSLLTDLAKQATITASPDAPDVQIALTLTPEIVEKLSQATQSGVEGSEAYKMLRMYQLLLPSF